jgi:phosphoserine phosphatase
MKAHVSKEAAYLWLAQINAGQKLSTVLKWSEECTHAHGPVPVFAAQKEIINHLHKSSVEVFIVTASIQWAVVPAAKLYNIDQDHVIGIRTKIVDGIVTEEQDGIITYREGKVAGLLERTQGVHPFYVAGNSEGDLPLLEASTHLRMVLASAHHDKEPELHDIEQHMIRVAEERGWFFHNYV